VPNEAIGVSTFAHMVATQPRGLFLVGRDGADPVAIAFVRGDPDSLGSPHPFAGVGVVHERRGAGLGTQLFERISAHARALGKVGFEGPVLESDLGGVRFVARRGYVEVERAQAACLDLAGVDGVPPRPPAGVEVVSIDAAPELERGVYEVARTGYRDLPGKPIEVGSFEEWRAADLGDARRDLSLVALVGGRPVGFALLRERAPGTGWHVLTAVERASRGRGIAGALKRAQVAAAKRAGLTKLMTHNEVRNEPILRLNRGLGYAPLPATLIVRGPLAG
jgi:GNAT superfamily N-acetyltransferase